MTQKICLHLAYIGKEYKGWQRQEGSGGRVSKRMRYLSIQEIVEEALQKVLQIGEKVNVTATSRTDSGTSALYQYAWFYLNDGCQIRFDDMLASINACLPQDIRVWSIFPLKKQLANGIVKTKYKKYVYFIEQALRPKTVKESPYLCFIAKRLNILKMREALGYLTGSHDFAKFSKGGHKYNSTIRTIIQTRVTLQRNVKQILDLASFGQGSLIPDVHLDATTGTLSFEEFPSFVICIELTGDGFLQHMVRRIMGTLRWIGEETYSPSYIQQILNPQSREEAGPSLSAIPLWLQQVWFTHDEWQNDQSTSSSSLVCNK